MSRLFALGTMYRWLLVLMILVSWMPTHRALCDEVKLRSGDVLQGTIVEHTEIHVILEHQDLGKLTIPGNTVVSISQDGQEELPTAAPEPKPEWDFSVVFGGAFSNDDEGEKLDFHSRFNANRETPSLETNLSMSYIYKFKDEEVDENNFNTILNQAWLLPDTAWFYMAIGRYDYDGFRSWRQRLQTHGGAGYLLIDREDLQLSPFVGLGFRKDIGSEEELFLLEAVLGFKFSWEPIARQRLELLSAYYPSITGSEYRVVNTLDWKIPMGEKTRLSFNTHCEHEYASNPDPGYPLNTIRLTWGLQWDF